VRIDFKEAAMGNDNGQTPAELADADFKLIGEVIVHAAALENMLAVLASVMMWKDGVEGGREPAEIRDRVQSEVLGGMLGTLLAVCRLHERVLHEVRQPEYLRDLWDDCAELADRRNALAHSYWERLADGRIVAKRALPKRKREPGVDFITVGGTLEELAKLREQIADAIGDIKDILDAAWPDEWLPVARFALGPRSATASRRPRAPREP
jgi:hypothetical protein